VTRCRELGLILGVPNTTYGVYEEVRSKRKAGNFRETVDVLNTKYQGYSMRETEELGEIFDNNGAIGVAGRITGHAV
jgi:hypothetical protein